MVIFTSHKLKVMEPLSLLLLLLSLLLPLLLLLLLLHACASFAYCLGAIARVYVGAWVRVVCVLCVCLCVCICMCVCVSVCACVRVCAPEHVISAAALLLLRACLYPCLNFICCMTTKCQLHNPVGENQGLRGLPDCLLFCALLSLAWPGPLLPAAGGRGRLPAAAPFAGGLPDCSLFSCFTNIL